MLKIVVIILKSANHIFITIDLLFSLLDSYLINQDYFASFITMIIKSISINDGFVSLNLKLKKDISFKSDEIKKIFIKKQTISIFYLVGLSFLSLLFLVYYFNMPNYYFITVIVFHFLLYLFLNRMRYSLVLIDQNDEKYVFYFHVDNKFEIIEQIKIIRASIEDELFHNSFNA